MKPINKWPFVSVIIPTYNRSEMLCCTVNSFLIQNYPPDRYEIIIADNNSTDTTREVSTKYVGTSNVSVKYLFEQHQGVHYARNSAAKKARGEILYFTDDDMIADQALLHELMKIFVQFSEVGCATGLVLPLFQKEPPDWVIRNLWNSYLSLTEKGKPEELIISKNNLAYSCHEAIRRDLFFKAGGFHPENTAGTWIGSGETGLSLRIEELGYKFAYTSKSIIYHMIPKNRTTLKYLIKRIGNQGFADSYTDYRTHRNRSEILPAMLKRNIISFPKKLSLTLTKVIIGKLSWRFILANYMYFHKKNVYDLKLYKNESFRKMVEVDDWLNEGFGLFDKEYLT